MYFHLQHLTISKAEIRCLKAFTAKHLHLDGIVVDFDRREVTASGWDRCVRVAPYVEEGVLPMGRMFVPMTILKAAMDHPLCRITSQGAPLLRWQGLSPAGEVLEQHFVCLEPILGASVHLVLDNMTPSHDPVPLSPQTIVVIQRIRSFAAEVTVQKVEEPSAVVVRGSSKRGEWTALMLDQTRRGGGGAYRLSSGKA